MTSIRTTLDLTLERLQQVVGGRFAPTNAELNRPVRRIETDCQQVQPGHLFWDLSRSAAESRHAIEEAAARGAAGIVTSATICRVENRTSLSSAVWRLVADDARAALGRLARWNRDRFRGTMIGVAGAIGKTTTRQMVHAALSSRMIGSVCPVSAIENQTTGLIGIEPERDYAIYELRTRAADLPAVCSLLRPEIGIVTHCEARAEVTGELTCAAPGLEMLEALSSDGWAVLTGDDPQLRRLATGRVRNTVWVGRSLHCDLVATHIEATSGHLRFRVNGLPICVPVWGRHYLHSVLAALAVGRILGLTLAEAAEGLADFQGPPQRCQVQEYQGAKLIDDTYSSHPTAVRAALELLRDFDATGRRIIVCGDLPDLDAAGELAHRELGDQVVTLCGADLLVTCGEHSREIAEGAARAGMPPSRITACTDPEQAVPRLDSLVKPGDVVLVKGARGRAMDRVLNLLAPVSERRAA